MNAKRLRRLISIEVEHNQRILVCSRNLAVRITAFHRMKKYFFSFLLIFVIFGGAFAQTEEPRKFEEFGETDCEDLRGRLDNFMVHLRNEPNAKGLVLVYEGKYSRPIYNRQGKPQYKDFLPAVGESKYRMTVLRNHFKFRKFPADKISVIDGGFRETFTMEFWIIPNGAESPAPTPTLDKMKYRKGKPSKIVCET